MLSRAAVIKVTAAFFTLFLGILIWPANASATMDDATYQTCLDTADNGNPGLIESQREACRRCNDGATGSQGAMWINNSPTNPWQPGISLDKSDTGQIIDIYIRGNVYSCTNSYTPRGTRLAGVQVKIINQSISGHRDEWLWEYHEPSIAQQPADQGWGGIVERGSAVGATYLWNNNFGGASQYTTAKLDVDKFKQSATKSICSGTNDECYAKTIYIYRCYAKGSSLVIDPGDSACDTSAIDVILSIPAGPATLTPNSQISTDCSTFKAGNAIAQPGQKVCFKHWYNRNTSTGTINYCKWWIQQNGTTSSAPSSTLPTDYPNSSTNSSGDDCANENIDPTDNILKTNYGKYITITFTVPTTAQDGERWCQSSAYMYRIGPNTTTQYTANPSACIEVKKPPCTGPCCDPNAPGCPGNPGGGQTGSTCTLDGVTFTSGTYGGTTVGRTTVANLTRGDGEHYGTAESDYTIYARPGDSIQFHHTLCPGAQAVRVTRNPDHHHDQDGDEQESSYSEGVTQDYTPPGLYDTCTITATPSSYLFRNAPSDCSNLRNANQREMYSPGRYTVGGAEKSSSVGLMYQCANSGSGFNAVFPAPKENGYQIPSFSATSRPLNCNTPSTSGTTYTTDVGKTISQKLSFGPISASSEAIDEGWSDRYCSQEYDGSCIAHSSVTKYHTYVEIDNISSTIGTTEAQVKIPYNYTTSFISGTNPSTVFAGGDHLFQVNLSINKRKNPAVTGSESEGSAYATITKTTVKKVIAFTYSPTTESSNIAHARNWVAGDANKDACAHYRGASATQPTSCQSISTSTTTLNTKGDLGTTQYTAYSGFLTIPDAAIGTKFCIAVGIWPSDSHDNSTSATGTNDIAMSSTSGAYWNYSEPICSTVAKKPTVQFLGAGVYSSGKITTSQTEKVATSPPYQLGSASRPESGYVNSSLRSVFGSFSQYEAIAKGSISGFSSGSTFGYSQNNSGDPSAGSPGGYPLTYGSDPNTCAYSTQTITNYRCEARILGNASNISSSGSTIISRLKARYTDPNDSAARQSGSLNLYTSHRLNSSARYIHTTTSASIDAPYCLGPDPNNNNTLVIDVTGTLTINANLRYGSGSGNSCAETTYTDIASLPQIIIFADDIHITSSVSQIDAWLISGQNSRGSGIIHTCYGAYSGYSNAQIGQGSPISQGNTGSLPCNSQLTINGPVFATKLILNRNGGAESGNASILPAETFRLRADAYLWAYHQATRYSQAVTTYSRELAPRY